MTGGIYTVLWVHRREKLGLAGGTEEGFSQEGCFSGDLRKSDQGRRGGREFQADRTVHANAQRHENAGYIIQLECGVPRRK